MHTLHTLTRPQGANRALIDEEVTVPGYALSFADEPVLVRGFRKMIRSLEYDVAEVALTTYLTAKEHGVAITALPIFLVRGLHHGATQVRRDGRIATARDLAGGRVGVNRGYTVTTGVWGRAALADMDLDLDSVTWVCSGDEHVASYVRPRNVVSAPDDRTLGDLLVAGEVDAVVGAAIDHPDVVPLVTDPEGVGLSLLQKTGVFPINHLVVVRDDVIARHPDAAVALFSAFAEAKRRYVNELAHGLQENDQDLMLRRVMAVTGADPLPYGLRPNLSTLEALLEHASQQHILTRPLDLNDVFAADTLGLDG